MLNLYSVYSNVRRLCALLCPAISFLHFHVLQVGPLISRPSFSRPAFSAPPIARLLIGPFLCAVIGSFRSDCDAGSVAARIDRSDFVARSGSCISMHFHV